VPIVNGYATLADIKRWVGIPDADTADDALLELAVETASRAVEYHTSRPEAYFLPTTPAPVRQATLILAAKYWKRKDASFGVAGSAEFGSEVRILAGDLDAERLLAPYRTTWGFV
jgi:hypothetical protein